MYCAISGEVPQQPVVSSVSGHVFEQRLIEKALEASNGVCPATGQALETKQLIPIKADLAVRPRPLTATSLPGMLAMFQNEWDDVMLETHSMKQQLHATRKELSHALYQHDAACRVIARLVRERDEARGMLAGAQSAAANGGAVAAAAEMEVDSGDTKLPEDVVGHMTEYWKRASKGRKKRPQPPGLSDAAAISGMKRSETGSSPGALFVDASSATCLDVCGGLDGTSMVVGSSGGSLALVRRSGDDKSEAKSLVDEAHATGVKGVAFLPSATASSSLSFGTVGEDGLKLWKLDDSCSMSAHLESAVPLVGLAAHPTGEYVACCGADASWQLYATGGTNPRLLASVDGAGDDGQPATSTGLAFHPDGLILATPVSSSAGHAVRIWDVKERKNVHTFEGHTGIVRAVAFSENGYYMASASDDSTVRVWDLRKLSELKVITCPAPATSVTFDHFGKYIAYSTASSLHVDVVKEWTSLASIETSEATTVKFAKDAKYLAAAKTSGSLDIFE